MTITPSTHVILTRSGGVSARPTHAGIDLKLESVSSRVLHCWVVKDSSFLGANFHRSKGNLLARASNETRVDKSSENRRYSGKPPA